MPTFDCSLRCVYCYARGGERTVSISREIAESAIDNAGSHDAHLNLYFVGGGEPLLDFELVCDLVARARDRYASVGVNVVTNGLLTDRAIAWLTEQEASIRVSYDGVRHDIQRPRPDGSASAAHVRNTIRALATAGLPPMVQSIVTGEGVATMEASAYEAAELGANAWKPEPCRASAVSRATADMTPPPREFAAALLSTIRSVAAASLDMAIDTGFFSRPASGYYCGAANGNRVVAPDGRVTACVEVARAEDPYSEQLLIGAVRSEGFSVSEVAVDALRQAFQYESYAGGCGKCHFRLLCQGGCPMANVWQGGFPPPRSKYTCTVEHTLLPELLLDLATDARVAAIVLDGAERFCV